MNKNKYFNGELISIIKYYNNLNTDKDNKFDSNIINCDLTIKLKDKLSRHLIGFINVKEYENLYYLKRKYILDFIPILLRKKNSLIYYLCSISLN